MSLAKVKDAILGLLAKPKDYLYRVALKKAVLRGIQALVAILASRHLDSFGVTVQVDPDAAAVAIMAAIEAGRNWLKQKYPKVGAVL